ncbi:MAG: hypothetical protein HC809_13045 [Gammaproteobacteria bacterium]|nr:hypothetical protein [Gammaproteobacteria bacterium]
MADLVPGFRSAIEANGSVVLRAGLDLEAASELGVAPRWDAQLILHSQSRWFLEHTLRRCVLESSNNVSVRSGQTIRGLQHDEGTHRITGVEIEQEGRRHSLACDLVIDATGRGEGGLRWLTALGLDVPAIEEVSVDFGYASATVKLRDEERAWKALATGNLPRVGARGGVLLPIEGGLYICSLGGRAGDYPPDEQAAFLEFAKGLPHAPLYEALSHAEFLTPISRMIYPANRFRRYEAMTSLVGRLLPVGDALCSFNPTYGQGMSSAALQCAALAETFANRSASDALETLIPRYLPRAAEAARLPWRQANFNDFLYPTTEAIAACSRRRRRRIVSQFRWPRPAMRWSASSPTK